MILQMGSLGWGLPGGSLAAGFKLLEVVDRLSARGTLVCLTLPVSLISFRQAVRLDLIGRLRCKHKQVQSNEETSRSM